MKTKHLSLLIVLLTSAVMLAAFASMAAASPIAPAALPAAAPAAPLATCNVPATHATIAAALADPACDPIIVAAGTYTENLVVNRTVSIIGAGPGATIVDGDYVDTVFRVGTADITLRLEGMTIQHGQPAEGAGGGVDNMTVASGSVTIHNCDVRHNAAVDGGGISNSGQMTITASTVYSNTAVLYGGGIENYGGTLWISSTVVLGNTADSDGGGIDTWGGSEVTLINSTIQGNLSGGSGGGILSDGDLTIERSTFTSNKAIEGGGIFNGGYLTVENSTFTGDNWAFDGGGIANMGTASLLKTTLAGNSAELGGGIINVGIASLLKTTLVGNRADDGGGIWHSGVGLTIVNSTLSGNTATGDGGGILYWGREQQSPEAELSLLHTTVVSNTADADDDTVGSGGGIALDFGASAIISNSILSGNVDYSPSSTDDCAVGQSVATSGGYNLLGSGCIFDIATDVVTTTPDVEPLADNGGATETHMPRYTSAAMDLVPAGVNGCGTTVADDQRDYARPVNGACEAGSVEAPLQPFTIGDVIWYDTDQDGIQDAGEPGLENITVELYDDALCTDTVISSTVTNGTGTYAFTVTSEMTTCIAVTVPAGWTVSPQDQGADDALDSDAGATGTITTVNVTADNPTFDIGLYVAGQVGDRVFCDADNDAAYDAGEGMADVTVTLYDDSDCIGHAGTPVLTTTTTGDGYYLFTGLESYAPGASGKCYVVGVDTADPDLGTCVNPVTLITDAFHLNADTSPYLDADFGFEELSLGDLVWYDTDQDGVQDAGEPGVENVGVDLYADTCDGQQLAADTTDADGLYDFPGLQTGTYCLAFSNVPAGWTISARDQGADDTIDSDADPATLQIPGIVLNATDLTQDIGAYAEGSIGDTTFCDANGNDSYDAGEGVAGVTVRLYDDPGCDGVPVSLLATQETVGDGQYTFTGLPAGPPGSADVCYVVEVDTADMGVCSSPITPLSYTLSLEANSPASLDNDFGFSEPTAVDLVSFYVDGVRVSQVDLKWATAAEIDNFGFRIYRAPTPTLAEAEVVAFVNASDNESTYTHTDTLPEQGRWWYWLADVDTSGGESFHGPVAITTYFRRIYIPVVTTH
jgi:uncharacterized protein YbdZ (MbtH family)